MLQICKQPDGTNEKSKIKIILQGLRLSYLAGTLADAQDMESAQSKLKEYALQNSTAAQENFVTGSVDLTR